MKDISEVAPFLVICIAIITLLMTVIIGDAYKTKLCYEAQGKTTIDLRCRYHD